MSPEERARKEEVGELVEMNKKAIHMGLDLQGGMYLIYEVDLPKLAEQLAHPESKDDSLMMLLEKTREDLGQSTEEFTDVLRRNFSQIYPENESLNRYWGRPDDSDGRVIDYLRDEASEAMDRSHKKLRNRIDQFGVSEPNIQKVRDRRILIELPGATDRDQAKNLIGRTALLEFKLVRPRSEFAETLQRIDRRLALEQGMEPDPGPADTTAQDTASVVADTARTDTTVLTDETRFENNPLFSMLINMNALDPGKGHEEVGASVDNVERINYILSREDIQDLIHRDAQILWGSNLIKIGDKHYRALFMVDKQTELTGKYLTEANVAIGSDVMNPNAPEVHFTLNRDGARIFGDITEDNVNERLALVLDNKVVSAPRISQRLGARSRITGIPTMDEAKTISIVLRVGRLDAPIKIEEERTVGPSLGADSIRRGQYSVVLGLLIIIIFMVIYYKVAGLIADLALVLNIIILMAVLAQLGLTLTLPGVAGIVLTIGMAVDANVLVFERIREELRTGKTVRASIDAGYSRAFRTILDANITTLLTALVLYQFGTGPVRGFAVTLSIGIVVSMFTALIVTRVVFDTITSRRTLTKLSI
jgi:preprotein translocase subunit SecD